MQSKLLLQVKFAPNAKPIGTADLRLDSEFSGGGPFPWFKKTKLAKTSLE